MEDPKESHGIAIKNIGRYLLATHEQGMYFHPNKESFECYMDADYCGNWDKSIAADDPDTARSRHGFIVKYAGVPIYWASKLQTQIALSTAEAKYIGLSIAARYAKGTMCLFDEINQKVVKVITTPMVYCRLFEDNSAALEIAKVPKVQPRT